MRAIDRWTEECEPLPVAPPAAAAPSDEPTDGAVAVHVVRSFDDVYLADCQLVLRHAWWLAGDRSAAEDLTQEGFAAAYRRWDHVGGLDWPAGWVLRVVSNKAASLRRRAATDLRVRGVLRADMAEVSLDESRLELWDMVRTLPTRQAQAVALHYGCGLTVEQCAESMECGPETVKTHLTRARRSLARRYGAGGAR